MMKKNKLNAALFTLCTGLALPMIATSTETTFVIIDSFEVTTGTPAAGNSMSLNNTTWQKGTDSTIATITLKTTPLAVNFDNTNRLCFNNKNPSTYSFDTSTPYTLTGANVDKEALLTAANNAETNIRKYAIDKIKPAALNKTQALAALNHSTTGAEKLLTEASTTLSDAKTALEEADKLLHSNDTSNEGAYQLLATEHSTIKNISIGKLKPIVDNKDDSTTPAGIPSQIEISGTQKATIELITEAQGAIVASSDKLATATATTPPGSIIKKVEDAHEKINNTTTGVLKQLETIEGKVGKPKVGADAATGAIAKIDEAISEINSIEPAIDTASVTTAKNTLKTNIDSIKNVAFTTPSITLVPCQATPSELGTTGVVYTVLKDNRTKIDNDFIVEDNKLKVAPTAVSTITPGAHTITLVGMRFANRTNGTNSHFAFSQDFTITVEGSKVSLSKKSTPSVSINATNGMSVGELSSLVTVKDDDNLIKSYQFEATGFSNYFSVNGTALQVAPGFDSGHLRAQNVTSIPGTLKALNASGEIISSTDLSVTINGSDCKENVDYFVDSNGYMWELKKSDGGLHDKQWIYTWADKPGSGDLSYQAPNYGWCYNEGSCDTRSYATAVNAEKGTGYCGFTDWEIPTIDRLKTLLDVNVDAAIPTTAKNNDPSLGRKKEYAYWSRSTDTARHKTYAYYIDFYNIKQNSAKKSDPVPVRLVRKK